MSAAISSFTSQTQTVFDFEKLSKANSKHSAIVQKVFENVLAPLYGDQSLQFGKAIANLDRTCETLCLNDEPVGLLIFKNSLQNEFD
jgi:hypothetical protein